MCDLQGLECHGSSSLHSNVVRASQGVFNHDFLVGITTRVYRVMTIVKRLNILVPKDVLIMEKVEGVFTISNLK